MYNSYKCTQVFITYTVTFIFSLTNPAIKLENNVWVMCQYGRKFRKPLYAYH